MEFTKPEEMILAVDTDELAAFIAKHSRNRLGWDKAQQLQAAAKSSFGVDFALDAYRFQLRILLQQIRFSEEQLALLEKETFTHRNSPKANILLRQQALLPESLHTLSMLYFEIKSLMSL